MSDLFKLTVLCDKCGTGHLPTPVSKTGPPPLCRKCDAPLVMVSIEPLSDRLPVGCRHVG